jgi:hypothetical protein
LTHPPSSGEGDARALDSSEETRKKISTAMQGNLNRSGKGSIVEVLDLETNETSIFPTFIAVAKMLGVSKQAVSHQFKKTNCFIFRDRYQIKKKANT